MSELIDKSEVSKRLCAACSNMGSFACISCVIPHIIKDTPTIEAETVRHGRWIPRKAEFGLGTMYECSVCHGMCEHYTHLNYDPSPYCMHCGARMDGGADNADN